MTWIQKISSRPRLFTFALSALTGVCAILLAYAWSEQQQALWRGLAQPKGGVQEVLVFSKDLEAGDLLSAQTVAVRAAQRSLLPSGVLSPDQFPSIQGQRVGVKVKKGELLLGAQIVVPQAQDSVAMARAGYRLVPVDRSSAQMAWSAMTPRDRIDVWALGPNPEDLSLGAGGVEGIQRQAHSQPGIGARPIAMSLRVLSASGRKDGSGALRVDDASPASYFLEIPESLVSSYLAAVASSQVRYVLSINGLNLRPTPAAKASAIEILVHNEGNTP